MSILEAISPTAEALLELQFFPCRYTWLHDVQEKTGSTVIVGRTEEAALKTFRRQHPHLTNATIIK
jgi:hypothetical protein